MTDPLLFALAALALLGAPGPTNALLALVGATGRVADTALAIVATLVGYAIAITAYRLVLWPVFAHLPLATSALKLVVAAYAGWLAFRLWTSTASTKASAPPPLAVFIATLLNPKALITSIALLPQDNALLPVFGLIFAVVVLITASGWALLGKGVATGLGPERARYIPRLGAGVLAVLAGSIAVTAFG